MTLEQAVKLTVRIRSHYRATAKVSDQQLSGMLAETIRRERDAPGRVDFLQVASRGRARRETMECRGEWIKDVNQSIPRTRNVIFFVRVLPGESNEHQAVDSLDIKRRITRRSARIGELADERNICVMDCVIDIDRGFFEVSGQQNRPVASRREGDPFVYRI